MTITPGFAGFIQGILGVAVLAIVSYLASAAHFDGILNPVFATVVAGLFSSLESILKAQSGGTTALFGSVKLK